jgi:hypothetical protein
MFYSPTVIDHARELAMPAIRGLLRKRRNAAAGHKAKTLTANTEALVRAVMASLKLGLTRREIMLASRHDDDQASLVSVFAHLSIREGK